jgi:pimeloyl-ACP methyl ester carboxylesterase
VALRSGRHVALRRLAEGGSGRTVVFCHPAPGAGTFDPDPEQTVLRDVTLLAVDRPGYGESDPVAPDEWATVDKAADDLAEVLTAVDAFAGGPVGVVGWSAGGRVALALAARRPDLVERVVVFGTPAPERDVPWLPSPVGDWLEALHDQPPAAVHAGLGELFAAVAAYEPGSLRPLDLLGGVDLDSASLNAVPGSRQRLQEMLAGAFAQGTAGLAADVAGYGLRSWGFEPAAVHAKTLLLYGSRDPYAANRHATWWQRRLGQARMEMAPGAGPLALVRFWKRALSHLVPSR